MTDAGCSSGVDPSPIGFLASCSADTGSGTGTGTADDPYRIGDYDTLKSYAEKMRGNGGTAYLRAHYKLTADIDASASKTEDSGRGWLPIAATSSETFEGGFDGGCYRILSLHINRSGAAVGLFGRVSGAHIKNLAVEGVNISADGTGNFNTGAIAGFMVGGSISNSYMTGAVASAGASSEVGGLVGKMQGGGRILNSYALGTVSAKRYAGGLVGATAGTNTIANSFALGAVTGADSTGGLVGNMLGVTVRNSYAAGQVSSAERAGGLAGTMGGGAVHNSYAMGAVSSSWDKIQRGVGGLVGDFTSGSIRNSYATGAPCPFLAAGRSSAGSWAG